MARDPEHLAKPFAKLVEETVWHEAAHYFGLNEREKKCSLSRFALS
jgi:predicted Zn-dependent protease with MMP-like domain